MNARLSIGAVAKATGIPANTIRTWERRYDFPPSERTSGGHRVYRKAVVDHLCLVRRALDLGHRPAQLLKMPREQLQDLLGPTEPAEGPVDELLDAVRRLDGPGLERLLACELSRRGAIPFFDTVAIPFLHAVGEAWENGEIDVFHEHFASQRISTLLSAHWYASQAGPRGNVVLAGLPGEEHVIGLHMVAAVLTQLGWNPIFLGRNTPVDDIVACAAQVDAQIIAVTLSVHTDPAQAKLLLQGLARSVSDDVHVICGGGGAVEVDGIQRLGGFEELQDWLEQLPRLSRSA